MGLSKGGSADRKIPDLSVSRLDSYACFVTVTNPLLFPKKLCQCYVDKGLLGAPSLALLGGRDGCCGQKHSAAEPDPLFHLCCYAAWSRVTSLDEMLFPVAQVASEVHRRGQLSHQTPAS